MIVSIVSIVSFIGYAIFVTSYFTNQKQENMALTKTIAEVISQDLAKLILLNNVSVASDISTKLSSFHHINTLVLYKKDTTPIYQYSQDHKRFEVVPFSKVKPYSLKSHHMNLLVNSTYQNLHLGYILIDVKVKTLIQIAKENMLLFLWVYVFMCLISYLLAIYFAKKFTNPIRYLVSFLQEVNLTGSLKKRITLCEKNEFGLVYNKINLMLNQIENTTKAQRIAAVAFETSNGMIITDAEKKVLQINHAYTKITGYALKNVVGKKPPVLTSQLEESLFYTKIEEALEENHMWQGELRNYRKSGEIFSEYMTIQEVCNEERIVTHYVFSLTDISQQKEAEKRVAFLLQYDPLTGLANKELLVESLTKEIAKEKPLQEQHFLLAFDIKNFKMINDAYGYEVGDLLLKEISQRLLQKFPEAYMIAKIGTDEFILSYHNVEDTFDELGSFAKMTAEYILSVVAEPFIVKKKTFSISVRIGIDLYGNDCKDVDTILKHADTALQLAKEKDEKIAFFDKQIEHQAQYHIDTYTQLQKALEKNEFELYYQPQYNQESSMTGVEALIRWNHPQEGLLFPQAFIQIAEKTGLIVQIGEWVLEHACQELEQWQSQSATAHLSMSVNISAKQFHQDNFIERMIEIIEKYKIPYAQLKFELVESLLIDNVEGVIQKMHALKKYGIKISMDDFGTGYSSLEYLRNLPLDQIKIDRSFIMNMQKNSKDLALVKTMISLGKAFGFEVIAEGMESKSEFDLLKALDCYHFQGYYFSKPLSIEDFQKKIIV